MSQDLAQQLQRVAAHVPLRRLNDKQIEALEVGRRFASEFIETAREGLLPVDGLQFALLFARRMGPEWELVQRGFMQDLQKALAKS